MIRLTVLYNLSEKISEEEFIKWRQETHKNYVESMPGVIHTDFSRITKSWPKDIAPNFRFQKLICCGNSPFLLYFREKKKKSYY